MCSGREDGIRTHETLLEPTPLAGERLRPLGHLSAGGDINEAPIKQGVFSPTANGRSETLLDEQNRNRTQEWGKSGELQSRTVLPEALGRIDRVLAHTGHCLREVPPLRSAARYDRSGI